MILKPKIHIYWYIVSVLVFDHAHVPVVRSSVFVSRCKRDFELPHGADWGPGWVDARLPAQEQGYSV